jgi:FkbH-like protein
MEQLEWLPRCSDFRAALRAARELDNPESRLAAVAQLANVQRDFVATEQLARVLAGCAKELGGLDRSKTVRLTPARVAVLASHTVDHLLPALHVACVQHRLALSTYVAPYGLYRQLLLQDDASLRGFEPQFIVLSLDAFDSAFDLPLDANERQVSEAVAERVDELRHLWRCARERYAAQVVQQTLVPPLSLFGSFEGLVPGAPFAIIERLNAALRSAAREDGVLLLDLAWHAARNSGALGDPVRWHQAKQLVSPLLAPLYGELLARVLGAALGLSRKCLVLDLDNTLWGGVIGDDGIEGIQLGNGSPTGEAFLAFQRYVALLAKRGVILAVCSKNTEEVAEAAFAKHPEMALRRSDIACFVANWEDKASNLRRIASTLNIGTDSLVFVDDNPAERDIVRRELPEVAVPELPEDVAYYPATVAAAGYFEAASFTADDLGRNRSYAANAERRAVEEKSTDLEGYLRSLGMTLFISGVGSGELARASQLINKSNQFNLSTRRYTEAELQHALRDPACFALCLRLVDRFSDNGLISVLLARPDPSLERGALLIDTWLMSCRVLGRQVEAAALEVLAREAEKRGASALVGEYRPTSRNGMVAAHYEKLGFSPMPAPAGSESGATFWRLGLPAVSLPTHFIKLEERA